MTLRNILQSRNLVRLVIYLSVIALLIYPVLTWLGVKQIEIEELLIFCGGFSNLIAVIDISRHPRLMKGGKDNRRVRVLLLAELLAFAWIIGFDFGHVMQNDFWRMTISIIMVLTVISIVAFFDFSDSVKTAVLIFGLLLSGAVHTNAEMIESVLEDAPDAVGRVLSSMNYADPSLLNPGDISNIDELVNQLRNGQDPPSQHLRKQITPNTQRLLDTYDGSDIQAEPLRQALVEDINKVLGGPSLYDAQRFGTPQLWERAQTLIDKNPQGEELIRLNRLLLQRAYPYEIAKRRSDSCWEWIAERMHAWLHLLFIPFMYLTVDTLLKGPIETAKKGLPLDTAILVVGLACAVAGFKVGNPRFEAGAVAAVLLLGNWIYVSYVHTANGQPSSPPVGAQAN
ncbi:MAG TPA: hypothetical protein VJV03_04985 [Pyrinomonadaceae bacterium]|nr:hypothetical protein [Pyrinomonadaceae bacterium]